MKNQWLILLTTSVCALLMALTFLLYMQVKSAAQPVVSVTSFEECKNAGYPVMESYPEQCRTPEGVLFVQEVEVEEPTATTSLSTFDNENTESTENESTVGYVTGQVSIGPICPVEDVDNPCVVPPETYTSRNAAVFASDESTLLKKTPLSVTGNYKITLSPGTYYIQIQPAGIGAGEMKKVVVTEEKTSTVDFDIDTGIR